MFLHLEHVSKSFGQTSSGVLDVLQDIDLEVEKGEFVSIVGPSGCGKSTLLYLISGLEQSSQGRILMNGRPVTAPGPDRVVVFQEAGLFPWLTVLDNITYGLRCIGTPKKEAREKGLEMLRTVHLSRYVHAYPHQLSGGMKQRVAIARALVMEPDVLLMDEPFAALDEQTRIVLHHELLNIWRKTQVTILFVTHNIREAVQLSERILVMGTRPGHMKAELRVPTARDGIAPDSVTLYYEQQIITLLKEEIEQVVKEEMGDDYCFEAHPLYRDVSGDLGSHI